MTLVVEDPSPEQDRLEVVSASQWRTDRVNVIVCGDFDTGKTDFAARFPKPVILDTGENGALTIKKMFREGRLTADVPIIRTTSFADALAVVSAPQARLGEAFRGTRWEGYEKIMETLAVDTVSTLEEWCTEQILEAKGWSDLSEGTGGGWTTLKRRMGAFFRAAWNLPLNTVLLAHAGDARPEVRDRNGRVIMKSKPAGPLLSGQLVKTAPALADFMLYFTKEADGMGGETFVGYAGANPAEFPTKNRLRQFLPSRLENPSYEDLRRALDQLEATRQ